MGNYKEVMSSLDSVYTYKNISISEFCYESYPCKHYVKINDTVEKHMCARKIIKLLQKDGFEPNDEFMGGHFNYLIIPDIWLNELEQLFNLSINESKKINIIIDVCLAKYIEISLKYKDLNYDKYNDCLNANRYISNLISNYIIDKNDNEMRCDLNIFISNLPTKTISKCNKMNYINTSMDFKRRRLCRLIRNNLS